MKDISADHRCRIDKALNYIHTHIASDLRAKKLAELAAYSEQYFHRLFRKITGNSVHEYVRRIRLETAASQLIFEPESAVQLIAERCGFKSLSSFSRAFKTHFNESPDAWRNVNAHKAPNGNKRQPCEISDPAIAAAYKRSNGVTLIDPDIVELPAQTVAYIRHQGYGREIEKSWHTLKQWAQSQRRSMAKQFGVYQSNPVFVPLDQCRYVACIGIEEPITRRGDISSAIIPAGRHAAFSIKGVYGELLPYISEIYERWLPQSVYSVRTTPAFVEYKKNQFLLQSDEFEVIFYLPLR